MTAYNWHAGPTTKMERTGTLAVEIVNLLDNPAMIDGDPTTIVDTINVDWVMDLYEGFTFNPTEDDAKAALDALVGEGILSHLNTLSVNEYTRVG